jgi:hypothetical protein
MNFLLPKSRALTNAQLNALEPWKARRCSRCARRYPDTLLNVQDVIEHGEPLQCLSRRSCDEFRNQVRR